MATKKFEGSSPYSLKPTYPVADYLHTELLGHITTKSNGRPSVVPVVGVIFGLGRAGSIHFFSIVNNPRIIIKYIVDGLSGEFKVLKAYWKLGDNVIFLTLKESERVYKNKEVAVVFIGSPTFIHYDIVVNAIANNKDIFCENPIAESTEETKKCYEAAKSKNKNCCKVLGKSVEIDWSKDDIPANYS